jgi:hypothetical protein
MYFGAWWEAWGLGSVLGVLLLVGIVIITEIYRRWTR